MKPEGIIQFVKFGVVGVANTAVDWVVFFVITHFIVTSQSFEPTAKAIAFLVAVTNSYIFNTIWTFKKEYKQSAGNDAGQKTAIFFKFFVVSLIGWAINYFAFKYTRFNLNQSQIVSLIAASGAAIFWNFFANKLWTYRRVK